MQHLSYWRLTAITSLGFALAMLSNTLEPAVLGHKVLELVPERKNTALGFSTFAGLVVAVLVQPIVGMLSDRTRTAWGRRLPYFVGGALLVIICLYVIVYAPVFALVVAGLLLIQAASNTVQGPYQALIPDHVPAEQRGQASGLKAMLEILAFVVGRQVSGRLVAAGNEVGAVSAAAGAFVIALAVTALAAREGREASVIRRSTGEGTRHTASLLGVFNVDWKAHPAFVWWFVNRFLFWAGFIALQTFLLFFMIDVVGMVEAQAQTFVGNLSTVIGLALLIVTLPSGWLADRLGRKPLVIGAGLAAAAGAALLMASRSTGMVTLAGMIIGLGVGVFISASWALATDIVPQAEAARYLGIANIATAGGSGAARLMGGLLIDPLNAALGPATGYLIVYGVAGALFFLSALALMRLPAPARATG